MTTPSGFRAATVSDVVAMLDAGTPVTLRIDWGRGKVSRYTVVRHMQQRIGALTLTTLIEAGKPDHDSAFAGKPETVVIIAA